MNVNTSRNAFGDRCCSYISIIHTIQTFCYIFIHKFIIKDEIYLYTLLFQKTVDSEIEGNISMILI